MFPLQFCKICSLGPSNSTHPEKHIFLKKSSFNLKDVSLGKFHNILASPSKFLATILKINITCLDKKALLTKLSKISKSYVGLYFLN